jgi:homoserine kinase
LKRPALSGHSITPLLHPKTVTVRVPGSTSNLGSGFDTLGLAVRLYSEVRVTSQPGRRLQVASNLTEADPARAAALVQQAARLFFRRTRVPSIGLAVTLGGRVPIGRGLGASATARVGLLVALNELTRAGLDRHQLLTLATTLEGHPDNASPALFGGFTVSGLTLGTVRCLRFKVSPRLKLVTLIPRFQISTETARKLVPSVFSKADTAHSLNRAALVTAAFASGQYEQLRGLFDDRVHQPFRRRLIPQLTRVLRAGEKAGAIGGWLSGSGSAIMCLTLAQTHAVARAMHAELPDSEIRLLSPDNRGAVIL